MKAPIIIGSAPSSGSTLLRVVLGRHPAIASGGEVALLDKRGLLQASPALYRASIATWFDRGYPAEYLGPSEELFEELGEYPWTRSTLRQMVLSVPDYASMLDTFYSRNVFSTQAKRWLDKCPSNIYCFDLISLLFPSARFIQIVRDARDSVVSHCRRGATTFRAVSRWYYATLSGLQYQSWSNYYMVRYEDLVRYPESTVRQICEFIGEPYLDSLLLPDQSPRKPRHMGWRHSETGPVRDSSVRQFHQQMTAKQRSMFQHVRLSPKGLRSLYPDGRTVGLLSPLKVQEVLGYSTTGLVGCPPLSSEDLRKEWLHFEQYQTHIMSRYGVWIECPVTLVQ